MDKLKTAFSNISTRLQHQQPRSPNDTQASNPQQSTSLQTGARISWPPKLLQTKVLGEIKDTSGRPYPRDLGRSAQLGGHTYYIFGDTFCFDSTHDFVGVTNNTIARIPDLSQPAQSQWLDGKAKVDVFVPPSQEEDDFNKAHAEKGENKRFVNWSFGGLIPIPTPQSSANNQDNETTSPQEAWLIYDTVEIHGATPITQCGTGIARVTLTDPQTGTLTCRRASKFPLFAPDAPLWGNMSCFPDPRDGWTYLLSGKGLDNFMARIRTDADFADPRNYQFLHKGPPGRAEATEWKPTYNSSGPFGPFGELAHDVLQGQGQGAILYLPDFAPEGRPYMWFGCGKFPVSELFVGCAGRVEGPWEVCSLGVLPEWEGEGPTGKRYCVYPHVWGSRLDEGVVLVGWSDDGRMGGRVVLGEFGFRLG